MSVRQDVRRIVQVLADRGLKVTQKGARDIWSACSSHRSASWLQLYESDQAIVDAVIPFLGFGADVIAMSRVLTKARSAIDDLMGDTDLAEYDDSPAMQAMRAIASFVPSSGRKGGPAPRRSAQRPIANVPDGYPSSAYDESHERDFDDLGHPSQYGDR